ncbi:SpoVT/AbrB-like protein [Neisseria sp. oral taxon 020 str. F0370]|uniref:AbrB/MazE/SpoVT family DNA-binding domain-containing protein n=1 Tax=unclassified Neisseria TaxID=2623750 RepID=UPI0002A1F7AA|nr:MULTISPECIES: AbrB/MazE/SpoVT family DNA-binding domain-containing protein [unclassified Neisseria]ASP16995.1 AbrB/MazE/SpoVT family DNA-binding domain-containing protein [Neisseria sp. KEM232]EKY04934.1 SpoVT/AbrB-like protein [Neisseria sp. oral taxon 020 str. F0370]
MLRLQKWGNSAAVRLPAEMLKQLGMKIGDSLETEIRDNELIVRAVSRPRYQLADLLAEMQQEPPRTEGWEAMPDAGEEVL